MSIPRQIVLCGLLLGFLSLPAQSGTESSTSKKKPLPPRFAPADTLSPEVLKQWNLAMGYLSKVPKKPVPTPDDLDGWRARWQENEKFMIPFAQGASKKLNVVVSDSEMGGVPIVTVAPADLSPQEKRVLIYVHGGAFTAFSAKSSAMGSSLMARASGIKVVSVDYTVAPQKRWREITDQVVAVYRAQLESGTAPSSIGIFGDSAGGALVAGSLLKARDGGTPMPGAVALWSPWSDLSAAGDTYRTLGKLDPMLTLPDLAASALAYAPAAEQKLGYVSPVYGDYSKGFPPTLVQCGTREMFLSNCVRQYRAIRDAGGEAVLDVYEGMPHGFQVMVANTSEGKAAIAANVAFWTAHLH